jgi:hypothetical protein
MYKFNNTNQNIISIYFYICNYICSFQTAILKLHFTETNKKSMMVTKNSKKEIFQKIVRYT